MCGFRNGRTARPLRDETITLGVGDTRSIVRAPAIPDQPVFLPAFADFARQSVPDWDGDRHASSGNGLVAKGRHSLTAVLRGVSLPP